jgi:tRNA (mo5U34)-methyltransferase
MTIDMNDKLDAAINTFNFFQRWEVAPGRFTAGPKDVARTCALLSLPSRLDGLRVLDIGPWNGCFSFECARRGAVEVISVGPEDPEVTGFAELRRFLGVDNVRYVRDSLYNIPALALGSFDIVLFLGVIYHLRNPMMALDILHNSCNGVLYVDSPIIDYGLHVQREGEFKNFGDFADVPIVYFAQVDEVRRGKDETNWFKPNRAALRDWISSSGFDVFHEDHTPDWGYVAARKGSRAYAPNLEGYNPGAALVSQNAAQ